MESTAPVSLPSEHGTPPPLAPPPVPEDKGGSSASTGSDDGFETASDPDAEDPAASPEPALPLVDASVPLAGGDANSSDDGENGSPKGESIENPDPVENSKGADDGFETASDPDAEDPAASPEPALPPVDTSVPIAGGDANSSDDGENGSPKGESIENPDSVENSKGAEEKEPPEDSVLASSVDGGVSGEETPTTGKSVDGVPDAGDEKDESLCGGGGSEEAASPILEGVTASEPVAVRYAVGAEKIGVSDAQDEKDENSIKQTSISHEKDENSVDQAAVLKPVEVGSGAVGDSAGAEKNGVPNAQDERDENSIKQETVSKAAEVGPKAVGAVAVVAHDEEGENLVVGSSEVLSSITEGAADSKAVEEEPVVVEAGQVEVADSTGSNQGTDGVTKSKAVALEAEKDGDIGTTGSNQTLEGEVELQSVEVESSVNHDKAGADDRAGFNRSDEVNASSAETLKLEPVESKVGVGGEENDEGLEGSVIVSSKNTEDSADKLDSGSGFEAAVGVRVAEKVEDSTGGSVTVDSEIAKDYGEHDAVNGGMTVDKVTPLNQNGDEKVVFESDELIAAGEAEASPILTEESKSREAESVQEAVAVDNDEKVGLDAAAEEEEGSVSDGPARVAILESSEAAKQIIKEMEEGSTSASSRAGFRSSGENLHHIDGQIVSDSDEEVDTDEDGESREFFDSAALTALLKAATGASSDGGIAINSQDATRIFSVNRPAGLGSSVPSLKPAPPRSSRPSPFIPPDLAVVGEPENNMDEKEKKLQEKVEQIRVKFLRLVRRLGHSPEDSVAAQVLYRLGLAEGIRRGRQISRLFSIETARKKALQFEEEGKEDLNFSCNILFLGKTGVGKSSTINSIFGERKSHTNPFELATTSVREISGTIDGVKIRILDTPGLKASVMDQAANRKTLLAIKKYTKSCPPDIVLYVDRMDTQTRDFNDLPLLRSITSILGSSIWFNAIVALTHAASAPPDGPNGSPLSYEVSIAQRSHVVQHSIRQAAGDMRLMNPVALVENHPSCRRNREGERVLPNGLSWRPQLLLLCYSSKILSEANALLKFQDTSPGKLFGFRVRSPPLPYLLSSLLQSRDHPKLSTDQGGENGDSDIDLDDLSDTDQEEEDEYDQLPPFKPLRKSQIAKLTKEQKRAYFDEYDYRVKLLQKKQWKEELRRLREMRKKGKNQQDDFSYGDAEDFDQDGAPAAVPVPLPDMVLPPSFDCDNPVYRYRFLEPKSQLLIRPVLDSHGWDHDCGYDGVSIEESLAIAGRFPAGLAVQITKDKKEFNIHLDSSISAKHGENGSSLAGFDIQSIGKQLAYILRSETKFKNLKKNRTAAGISVTFLGETVATGLKIEDQLLIGKRVSLVASTGALRSQDDVAYGANLEAQLRDKDYPIGQSLTTLGLSLMRWRSDLALGANLQSQLSIGRNSKIAVRVGLNNKLSGQITVRTSTSEQLQIALVGILPLAISFFRSILPGESYQVN